MVSTTKAVSTALSLARGDVVEFAGALKNLSPAMIDQLVKSGQLSQAKVLEALDTAALTEEEKKAIKVRIVGTTTTTGAAGATKLFDFSLKGLWATMKAFAVAHPAITTIAAIAAVAALVAGAIDWANTSIDEHNARLDELQSEASELQSELDSLNQELDTFADRLDELRNKKVAGTLTLVEKSELEDLERRNQLLQQYKDLIQDDLDANTAEKLSHAGAVLGGKYSALAWSQDPFAASAGPKELVAGDSATAPEILAAHAKLLQDLQAQEETFIQQYNNGEITKPILDEWRANIESRRNAIKNDTKILIQDLSASAKAVVDSGVTSGAEFDLAKEFLDAVEQWQLVDATVTEKIAYLAQNAPEAVKKIASQADGVLTEAKVAASGSLQDFVNLAIQLGVIPDNSAESLAALTAAIADVGKTAASSGVEVKTFEGIVSSLSEGVGAITAAQEDMAETHYLSADSVKALKEAGLEQYLVACENGYQLTSDALSNYLDLQQDEYETSRTTAKNAAIALIDNEEAKTRAINGTTDALINQLKAQQAEVALAIQKTKSRNGKIGSIGIIGDVFLTDDERSQLQLLQAEYTAIQDAINNVTTAEKNLAEFERARATVKRDSAKTNSNTTDANKSEFEEKYAEQKHALEMGKKTLKEFNDWLDGEKGYKNYFSDLTQYADEWRKYEKEVFDNVMQLHEQTVADFEHEISLLERVHNGEDALIAKYREEQKYLIGVREAYITTLQAAGRTADEIAKDDWVQELTSQINDLSDAIGDTYQDAFERTSDSLHELLDLTKELIKQEKEDQMDALEDQKDAFSDIIDAKKEMLRLTREEQEYNDKVSKSTKDIAKLQSRIDALSMDDSRQAALEKGKLEEELAELQKELADTQRDHYISKTEDALDKEEDAYHDLMDSKIEEIKSFLDDNEAITNAALKRLNNSNEALFNDLLGYAKHYTDTTEAELTNMWSSAMAAAKRYGDFTSALTGHTTVSDNSGTARRIVADMQANGVAWGEATTDAGRKAYADANLALGKQLASVLGTDVWRGDDGVWYINQNGTTKKLYDVYSYHTGGVVGKTGSVSPKSDELFALLQRDEVVMSRQMVDNTHDFLTGLPKVAAAMLHSPLSWVANAVQKGKEYVLHIHAPLNMEGVLPQEEILSTIKQYPRKVAEVVASQIQKL